MKAALQPVDQETCTTVCEPRNILIHVGIQATDRQEGKKEPASNDAYTVLAWRKDAAELLLAGRRSEDWVGP